MSMLNKYKQLYPEIITGKKLPLLYTEIFSDQNNNSPHGGVIQASQTAPLAQSTPPKPTAVKSAVNSVNQQPESPISSRDSLNTSGSNHEQLSSSSSPTGNLNKMLVGKISWFYYFSSFDATKCNEFLHSWNWPCRLQFRRIPILDSTEFNWFEFDRKRFEWLWFMQK